MLRNKRILVTSPHATSLRIVSGLHRRGAVAVTFPVIDTVAAPDPRPLDAALSHLPDYGWVLFTSASGVRAFFGRAARLEDADLGSTRYAAVGPGTAAAIEEFGRVADFVASTHTGRQLAHELAVAAGTPVLLPRSDIAGSALEEGLRAAGAVVDAVTAYRTIATPRDEMALATDVDAILFSSGSGARAFARLGDAAIELAHTIPVGCIGPSTASVAITAGLKVAFTAPVHTAEGLCAALDRFFEDNTSRG